MKLQSRLEVGTFIVARGRIATLVWRFIGGAALAAFAGMLWLAPAPAVVHGIGVAIGVLAALTAGSAVLGAIRGDEDVRLRVNMSGIAVSSSDGLKACTYAWDRVRRVILAERLKIGSGDEPTVHVRSVVVFLDATGFADESVWARTRAGREWMNTDELIARGCYVAGEDLRTAEAIRQACPRHIPVEVRAEYAFAGVRTFCRPVRGAVSADRA